MLLRCHAAWWPTLLYVEHVFRLQVRRLGRATDLARRAPPRLRVDRQEPKRNDRALRGPALVRLLLALADRVFVFFVFFLLALADRRLCFPHPHRSAPTAIGEALHRSEGCLNTRLTDDPPSRI